MLLCENLVNLCWGCHLPVASGVTLYLSPVLLQWTSFAVLVYVMYLSPMGYSEHYDMPAVCSATVNTMCYICHLWCSYRFNLARAKTEANFWCYRTWPYRFQMQSFILMKTVSDLSLAHQKSCLVLSGQKKKNNSRGVIIIWCKITKRKKTIFSTC